MPELLSKYEWLDLLQEHGVAGFNQRRRQDGFNLIDLSGLDLSGMDLTGINLSQANLQGALLDFAILNEAVLVFSRFTNASLREAVLYMVEAPESDFSGCDLYQADFTGADLQECLMEGADAKEAKFLDANLNGAQLQRCYLNDADFTGASMCGTDFTEADMEWAILTGVRYSETTRWGNQRPPASPEVAKLVSALAEPDSDSAEDSEDASSSDTLSGVRVSGARWSMMASRARSVAPRCCASTC